MYDYDPLGRRIAKSKLNKQGEKQCHTQFIWAGSHLVQEIRRGKNGEETDRTFTYIYPHPDSYEPLAQCYKEGDNAEHTVNYFHCDQIGVPREITDSQGKLLWKGRYDAWGQLIHDSNRHAQRSTHQPFRLQNQYFDQETGLHYNFLRYYEPALGQFITQDPIGLMGGMNLYQFAANTQTWVDEFGLISKKKLPCFKQLRDAYPNFNMEPSARPSSDSYAVNQCAIRVSSAMQKTGIDIKNLYPKGNQTSEGYARSSKGLADWIWKNYGKPKQMSLPDFANNSINLKSIFYELPKEGGIGHIDIIDQGKVGSGFYDAKEIWFWPMEDCK